MRGLRPIRLAAVLVVAFCVVACGPSIRRLDEAVIHEGPAFTLKVVRYYENLPLSYSGEIGSLQCSSESTRTAPAGRTNDAGWIEVGYVPALRSPDVHAIVNAARRQFFIVDNEVLVLTGPVLRISTDGCGKFLRWDPRTLPKTMIDRVEMPAHCAPKGPVDCSRDDYDFVGDREPVYADVHVGTAGGVSFLVRSRSFKPEGVLRVYSSDFGKTWRVEP